MQKNPFKFLDSYSREDRDIFFGRERETEELHSRVFQSRILVVYGISGTGKSSLINCGLANKFSDSDWLPVSIRRGTNINISFVENLSRLSLTDVPSKGSKSDPLKLIRSVYLDHFKPLFLIFDQFEEVFIFGTKSERDEFINSVKRITDSDIQCRFIFSVREEYLAGFTEFEKTIPSFLSNRVRIEKMTRQNAISAVEKPCLSRGIKVETGFSGSLLERLNPDSPEVELTYLQVCLDKIFRMAAEENGDSPEMTLGLLDRAGDVTDLLGAFLEEQISMLDDPEAGLVILKSFVSVKGTKHQITGEEVVDYTRTLGENIDTGTVSDLIRKFISLRILRDKDEHGRYELRHDSLATRIYEKITLVEKELLEVRQFIENSYGNYEKRNLFLSADDLQYIAPYEDTLFLNEKLLKYIDQSKRELHRKKRRRQNALIITASSIIGILLFFSFWAMRERGNAVDQKLLAVDQTKAALKAKAAADSAFVVATSSKELAVKNEQLAMKARLQSEDDRMEALVQREAALKQKSIAEKLSVVANEQARIANEEKRKAQLERERALEAEETARKLSLLATAQNLALTSLSMEKDPVTVGSLAVKAYKFNKENGGRPDDPIIFEALDNAWTGLDSSRHSLFTGAASEAMTLAGNSTEIVTADADGWIINRDMNGKISGEKRVESIVPVIFAGLNSPGDRLITQLDNFKLQIWKYQADGITGSPLNGHEGYIRSVAFSTGDQYLATCGMDNKIIIWDITKQSPAIIQEFRTELPVVAVVFKGTDGIIFALSDGSVLFRKVNGTTNEPVFSTSQKPLVLVWNVRDELLMAGCSDGSLLTTSKSSGSWSTPARYAVQEAGIDLIVLSPDRSLLATASRDKTIRLYFCSDFFRDGNAATGSVLLGDLQGRVRSMIFTPENKLVAGLSDKSIRIWETSSEKLAESISRMLDKDYSVSVKTSW